MRSLSGGKGMSDTQARAGALCEALERHSGLFQGNEPQRRARFKELGDAAIHPNDCMRFSERQYRDREAWNEQRWRFNAIPVPFDESAEISWTPVWSMTRREGRYLPTAYCYFRHPVPHEAACFTTCSNGNAAGNTLEEAILQGFFELVERDSVALWWYSRVRRPGVDLGSFDEPYLERLRAYLREQGRELWALDLTSDLQIPTFVALSRRTDGPDEQILFGFGSHLDARTALVRAVTEMNQGLLRLQSYRQQELRDHDMAEDRIIADWQVNATRANQPYLVPADGVPPCTAADYPRQCSDDLKEDVLICQRRVESHGMELLVLDQTRPDIGLPVVKVFVPGLRHFWARFAPGRLYDVPVKLGWLSRPLTEEELNSIPMFI
jgi:ribosomal protein S12 methylthiotransferase accessory factor